jgi:hypothetical protein
LPKRGNSSIRYLFSLPEAGKGRGGGVLRIDVCTILNKIRRI